MDRSKRYKRSECSDELGFVADFFRAFSGHFYRNAHGGTQKFLHLFGICCEATNISNIEIVKVTDDKTVRNVTHSYHEYDKIEQCVDAVLGDKVYDWSLVTAKKCDYPGAFVLEYGYGRTEKIYITVR